MTIGQTRRIQRAIMATLVPLQGTRATGNLTAVATLADVVIPAWSIAVPIIASAAGNAQLAYGHPVMTTDDVTVTSGGATVPIMSLLAGTRQNLPKDTEVRWDPPIAGLELTSTVAAAMTGGAYTTGQGTIKEIAAYESFDSPQKAQDVFLAKVGLAPAVVVAWSSSGSEKRRGVGQWSREDLWELYVVVTNGAGSEKRG